jgi:hypothetical protein
MSLQFKRRTKIRKRYIKKNNYVGIFRIFSSQLTCLVLSICSDGDGNETIAQEAKE